MSKEGMTDEDLAAIERLQFEDSPVLIQDAVRDLLEEVRRLRARERELQDAATMAERAGRVALEEVRALRRVAAAARDALATAPDFMDTPGWDAAPVLAELAEVLARRITTPPTPGPITMDVRFEHGSEPTEGPARADEEPGLTTVVARWEHVRPIPPPPFIAGAVPNAGPRTVTSPVVTREMMNDASPARPDREAVRAALASFAEAVIERGGALSGRFIPTAEGRGSEQALRSSIEALADAIAGDRPIR